MKKPILILIATIVVLLIIGKLTKEPSEAGTTQIASNKNQIEKEIIKRHCRMNWDEIDRGLKSHLLNEFISLGGINMKTKRGDTVNYSAGYHKAIYDALKLSTAYPETIEIEGKKPGDFLFVKQEWASIEDVDSGIIKYQFPFIAENKFSQRIRLTFSVHFKYTAGCRAATPIKIDVW